MMSARFEKLLHHISPARDTASALHRGASSGAVWHLGQLRAVGAALRSLRVPLRSAGIYYPH